MLALPLDSNALARWQGRLPAALETALVLLLALQAARLIWLAVIPVGPIGQAQAAPDGSIETPAFPQADMFFRSDTAGAQPVAGNVEALGYRLFGVRTESGGGAAILAPADGAQAAYRVGDEVVSGVFLDAVGADHAVLRSGGQRHRVDLPTGGAGAAAATPSAPVAALPVGVSPQPDAAEPAAQVDPQQLLAQTGLRPLEEDGRVAGYTVIPRGDGALLRQAGLQPGDVLLSVNGQSLTPERLGELDQQLQGESQAVIAFRRDGQTRTITLQAPQP